MYQASVTEIHLNSIILYQSNRIMDYMVYIHFRFNTNIRLYNFSYIISCHQSSLIKIGSPQTLKNNIALYRYIIHLWKF